MVLRHEFKRTMRVCGFLIALLESILPHLVAMLCSSKLLHGSPPLIVVGLFCFSSLFLMPCLKAGMARVAETRKDLKLCGGHSLFHLPRDKIKPFKT